MSAPVDVTPVDAIYRAGVAGMSCWSRNHRGLVRELPMSRWLGASDVAAHDRLADELVMNECSAATTLDVGCGPGRFTAALQHRGSSALGVDASAVAVALTRQRGGTAMRRDLFGSLPAQGFWDRVLLADGNIGIGGDPVRTLRRAAELLAPGGRVIVEIDHLTTGMESISHEVVRWESHHAEGPWFRWARLGAVALGGVATAAGLEVHKVIDVSPHVIAVLQHPARNRINT
ncbi:class I SAM-dependent methyltransferase [Mycolicibacterium sp. 050158]|uniref:class I SAM-dependent methyltransferase n=1 Tax=Mycolicibacterium sp. 050158 TaxID=3090602 RepID=UPI00299E2C7E|nr:class I SAM-dependent methyltransferase [Mycolicibacterium sp. 050158]MDX1891646.1 class I SAM-dependent methyltransferase [Mycolicibacterium sp. 050158]